MSNIQGRAFGSALLFFALFAGCQSVPRPDDLIVPGVRVGQVTQGSTEASLRAAFGETASAKLLPGDELNDREEYVTILYEDDPSRKLVAGWTDKSASQLSYVSVCRTYLPTTARCAWHTDKGVRMGLTLKELERRNGRPFFVGSWQTDFAPGAVDSWGGGLLAQELVGVQTSLCLAQDELPKEFSSIDTWPAPSSNAVLQRFNPTLCEIVVTFGGR
jgi:hypothetical protein